MVNRKCSQLSGPADNAEYFGKSKSRFFMCKQKPQDWKKSISCVLLKLHQTMTVIKQDKT